MKRYRKHIHHFEDKQDKGGRKKEREITLKKERWKEE